MTLSIGGLVPITINVPQVPSFSLGTSLGLPPLPNLANFIGQQTTEVSSDLASTDDISGASDTKKVWGITDAETGESIIEADSVLSFEYKNSYKISTYPQENGAFQAYNKVKEPFDIRLKFSIGVSVAARSGLLKQAEDGLQSTTLYIVVTPEARYPNANIQNINYQRTTRNGAAMIILEVWLTEIRQVTTGVNTSNTPLPAWQVQSPSDADPEMIGSIQPQDVSIAAAAAVCSAPSSLQSSIAAALGNPNPGTTLAGL